jgi:hypothetical protein
LSKSNRRERKIKNFFQEYKMKKIISNHFSSMQLASIWLLIMVVTFTFLADVNAQGRHGSFGRGGNLRHLPHHSVGIHHVHYFTPHIGSRIRVLPFGYRSLWFGGIPYYYFDGIYYQYFPTDKVYVAVDKPSGTDNVPDLKFDQVKLYDGSTLEGVFESATDSTITLRITGENHSIKINDIVSITFAPSIQDSTK